MFRTTRQGELYIVENVCVYLYLSVFVVCIYTWYKIAVTFVTVSVLTGINLAFAALSAPCVTFDFCPSGICKLPFTFTARHCVPGHALPASVVRLLHILRLPPARRRHFVTLFLQIRLLFDSRTACQCVSPGLTGSFHWCRCWEFSRSLPRFFFGFRKAEDFYFP